MENKIITKENSKFSEDENTLTIGDNTYITVDATKGCIGCAFLTNYFYSVNTVQCLPTFRKDKRSIIWKLKKQ